LINRLLYVNGKGYWRCGQPDGTFNEVRHCYDFLAVVDNTAGAETGNERVFLKSTAWREMDAGARAGRRRLDLEHPP
jgi:hypothetical protein